METFHLNIMVQLILTYGSPKVIQTSDQMTRLQMFFYRNLYYTDFGHQYIVRMGMDGSNSNIIVKENITWPNGIALDEPAKKIYWLDAKTRSIEQADLDGSNRKVSNLLTFKLLYILV